MGKARIGHFVEAQCLEAIEVDYIDERPFKVPFVCGCRNLGEALRRITEGGAMLRTKGEAGTGNIVEAVRHARTVLSEIEKLKTLNPEETAAAAKEMRVSVELVEQVQRDGKLPVVNFAAGGVATPADAALMMQLGVDGVFVGSGIFMSDKPLERAKAIVQATTHYKDAAVVAKVSENLGRAMTGISDLKGSNVNFRDREAKKVAGVIESMPGSDRTTTH